MIALRAINAPTFPVDFNRLTSYDAAFFTMLAIAIEVLYFRRKHLAKKQQLDNSPAQPNFDYLDNDVLMQPKQVKDNTEVPFTNFSMDGWHIAFYLALFVLFCYSLALDIVYL